MARPIAPTPILMGTDAADFRKDLEANSKPDKSVASHLEKCESKYNKFQEKLMTYENRT